MKRNTMRGTKNAYMTLAAVAVVMLLSAALVVPSSNAYAVSQNGNGKSDGNGIFSLFFTLFANLYNGGKTTASNGDIQGNGDVNGKAKGGGDENNVQPEKGPKDDNGNGPKIVPPGCKNFVPQKYNKNCS